MQCERNFDDRMARNIAVADSARLCRATRSSILRTEMEAGLARQRRRFTQVPSRVSVRWIIPPSVMVMLSKPMKIFSAGIDETQAEAVLRQDSMIAESAILRLINVPLTDGQFNTLGSRLVAVN